MEGHEGDDIDGAGHDNDARTRDFLAPANPWCDAGGSGLFPDVVQTFSGSSSFNQSRLGLESLDLNADEYWTQMQAYAGYIWGDNEVPPMAPTPIRVSSCNVACNLGCNTGIADEGGQGASTSGTSVGGDSVPPLSRPWGGASVTSGRRRGRSARVRRPGPAILDDNFNQDDNTQAPRVPAIKHKANWTVPNTQIFCDIWCHEIAIGNCTKGVMSKTGWRDLLRRYQAAIGLVHDREQLASRLRQLKVQWAFCNKLRYGSGLGRSDDGTIEATDAWWKSNTNGQSDLMKFRKGLLEYLDQMDKMFTGNTVDGFTSFVAGESGTIDLDGGSSDEEAADEQDDQLTPLSIGNKRASSTSTTASSPSKRSKSPALRAMDNNMRTHNQIANRRLCLMESMFEHRKQEDHNAWSALSQKIDRVTQIAKEMGISAQTPTLFRGLYNIIHNESDMDFFLANGPEERMIIIEQAAPVDVVSAATTHCVDPWDDLEGMMMAELKDAEDDDAFIYGMYQYALHIDKHLNRAENRQPAMIGLEWVQRKLGDSKAYYSIFRMSPPMFHRLHDLLVESYGLKSSTRSTSVETLGMFLWMLGAPQSVRQAENRFERSLGTISNMFNKVLKCMVKLAAGIIKPVDPQFRTMHPRLRNRRFYPYFKDCIGAIDGTHVPCVVPNDKFVQHLCRKGMTTQNVMTVCDFDMRFTFVLAGWPGSVHDMRVFNDGTTTYSHVFPHPPTGKYYLVESGYPNRLGYLAPYKGTKYHLQGYRDAPEPQGKASAEPSFASTELHPCT